ncbi:MAG: SDR family oxidoreductase [Thiomargarita sp.]|nr:SDR family oxidoreductase [Thiomargarita sp.]
MFAEFFKNKNYLITGASGGIGAGIARALATEGANVGIHYNSRYEGALKSKQSVEAVGGKAIIYQADLRATKNVKTLATEFISDFGSIDGLINNAGIILKASIENADEDYWDDVMRINLRAPYILSRAVLPYLKQSQGVVIHNTSIHEEYTTEYFSAYAASKAGLKSLTKSQALEWAKYGVRVNSIAPGVVPVERTQDYFNQPDNRALWLKNVPLNRFGKVEDIANFVVFLCSDKSSWTTGQSYTVDGGMVARSNFPFRSEPALPAKPVKIEN